MGRVGALTFIQFLPLPLLLLGFQYLESIVGGIHVMGCIEGESQALIEFKGDLTDTSGRLFSWIGDDCCSWRGVGCSNVTGHVIKLDLQNQLVFKEYLDEYGNPEKYIDWEAVLMSSLGGKVSHSLVKLEHLNYLDLSFNNFQGTHIPEFMGSFGNLRYLNLSRAAFSGTIPPHLGNLSRLQYLDLHVDGRDTLLFVSHGNQLFSGLTINNIQWLSGLSSLRYLDMEFVRFTGKSSTDWIQAVTMLPSLSELHLSGCELSNIPFSLPYANLTSLLVLDLASNNFNSSIPPWLFNISSLTVLDLSSNYLNGPIPDTFSNTSSLQNLDISYTNIGGKIPRTLGNLCNLKRLDVSGCSNINGEITEYVNSLSMCNSNSLETLNLGWTEVSGLIPSSIGNLSSLIELDLSSTQLSGPIPASLGSLLSLEVLVLIGSKLSGPIPASIGNLSSLRKLDLSQTQFTGPIPASIGNLSSLRMLYLCYTRFTGPIPASIGNLSSLRKLDLSRTQFTGPIPMSIGGLPSLRSLDLSYNQMDGIIPESIGELSELVELSLIKSSFQGVITEHHFKNVKSLKSLSFESEDPNKPLVFEVSSNWIPTFSLEGIYMINIQMGPKFPSWIETQKELSSIKLVNVGISDTIPGSFWNLCSRQSIKTLDLSHNHIRGRVPDFLEFVEADVVDLSFNRIEGSFPLWSNVSRLYLGTNLFTGQIPQNIGEVFGSQIITLDFSGNFLNGSIPSSICELTSLMVLTLSNNSLWGELPHCWKGMKGLQDLDFSRNFLNGSIPSSTCELTSLAFLTLSNNSLWGELPHCWKDMKDLFVLDLANNNLSGKIPQSIGSLSSLEFLILSNNKFHGKIPSSLKRCTSLQSIDLGGNGFSGIIPTWIGKSPSSFQNIRLRSNFLTGKIPSQLCNLSWLHILDLSQNNLSGFIPQCLGNLSALRSKDEDDAGLNYEEHMMVVTKGRELEYSTTLNLVKSIDLSRNHLSGEIPNGITRLVGLGTLNLSMNHLTGNIPKKIGNMQNLETLDLSINELSGQIPPSISSLTFLNHLNLSHNNLSGKIPSSTQLQSIGDASIYAGNSGLCGFPLTNNCPDTNISRHPAYINGENEDGVDGELIWFYIGIVMGFIVGFWCVCGTLFFKKSWRIAYFQFWSSLYPKWTICRGSWS